MGTGTSVAAALRALTSKEAPPAAESGGAAILPWRGERPAPGVKLRPRVLLLQGPVGPFFRRLQDVLEAEGFEVWRVCFHLGDRLFAGSGRTLSFWGDRTEWRDWLDQVLAAHGFDHIVLFGSDRPAHRIARELAPRHDVSVVALEEGYVRPGFVTVELGGNNANSPIAGLMPEEDEAPEPPDPAELRGVRAMFGYGAAYYLVRTLSAVGRQRELYHRDISAAPEIFYWLRNAWRRVASVGKDYATIERLLEHHDGRYFLVPLQVALDSNLREAALGWNTTQLISRAIRSFAESAPAGTHLVFKVHPMDRGHSTDAALIQATAAMFGVEDRVHVIETGSIGLLTRHAAGMITINSTSGLSAIFHGVPLLVIGRAFYAHPALATCAAGEPDFAAFWRGGPVAPAAVRTHYLAWIRARCLKPGDFYAARGIELACSGVLERLRETTPRWAAAQAAE